MRLFCLKNLSDQTVREVTTQEVCDMGVKRPSGLTKEQFREWSVASSTQGAFLSVWEGAMPKSRINKANPPVLLHGFIADYDSTGAKAKIMSIQKTVTILPSFIVDTFSPGKVRLIWEFEKPVVVGDYDTTILFLKELDKTIGISKALPGFDKCSFDPSQYFERGTEWHRVDPSSPISEDTLTLAMIDAAARRQAGKDCRTIPLERVAKEVERQFPGRWKKPFEIGQRGPLFWIPDGIDREGCVITADGMVSYSDRAESNFLPWKRILGAEFVKQFEESVIASAAGQFYCDNRQYYRKIGGVWRPLSEAQARLVLRVHGVSDSRQKGMTASDQDYVLAYVNEARRVYAAAPITFRSEDVVEIKGEKILNLASRRAMEPAPEGEGNPENFPWLWNYFNNCFEDVEGLPRARDVFFGWFWWFYSTALECRIQPGHVLVLVGPASLGKTLINTHVIGKSVGGSYDTSRQLMGLTAFNKQAGEVGHWQVDDVPHDGTYQVKRTFTQNLKSAAANPTILYQPKYADTLELPHLGRICVTMNEDAESMAILPAMDCSVGDKFILFKMSSTFVPDFDSRMHVNEQRIANELPYFLRWLLDWGKNIPAELLDDRRPRFKIKPYHHPDLVAQSHAESPEYVLQELLDLWVTAKAKDKDAEIEYTASALLQELRNLLPEATRDLKAQTFGRLLTKLVGIYRRLKSKRVVDGVARYTFDFST